MNKQYQQAHERYPGIPSEAMRAKFPDVPYAVLSFCCVLGDIWYDICLNASDEEWEAIKSRSQQKQASKNLLEGASSSASTQTPEVSSAKTTRHQQGEQNNQTVR